MGGGSRVRAGDLTQDDDEQAIVESFNYPLETIPLGNHAARQPCKRKEPPLDTDVRDGKRTNTFVIGGGFGFTDARDVHQSQCSSEESELPSSSGQRTETALGNVMFDCCEGSPENEQHFRSLEVDRVKHKIFLCHSGAQKDFVEQLCVDLERGGCIAPFFDQREHSLPKGKEFVSLIKEAAQHCEVAVVVLSKEFLCSKWPMLELVEFHGAQQAGNQRLNMLPLFYRLPVEDLKKKSVEERWMPKWLELAKDDKSIDVVKCSEAVRALRKVNGLVFGQKGLSEVRYRKDIVRSICKLSPPDLSYGSSRSMVGFSRMCEEVSNRFVRGMSGGPSFLGLYGTMGTGKTTLAKGLCDHFRGGYMGRVCLVDLGETFEMSMACHVGLKEPSRLRWVQLERVKRILDKLCGLDKFFLDKLKNLDEGVTLMQTYMKRQPVFLVIDNVTSESSSWNEAWMYLSVGFHPESKIVITSRSRSNIGGLVPDIQLCVPMPSLSVKEAGALFLRSVDPSKSILGLTSVQQNIVEFCIKQCLIYEVQRNKGRDFDEAEIWYTIGGLNIVRTSYHPIALSALGDFFRRYFSNPNVLQWSSDLEEIKEWLGGIWKVQSGIGGIFELQFHSLPLREQLLFLDIAAFWEYFNVITFSALHVYLSETSPFEWLCKLYGETRQDMERQLQDLERSGMIRFESDDYKKGSPHVQVAHDIYKRFAKWYATNHGVELLEDAWCVCKPGGSSLNWSSALWSELVRLRMFDISLGSARLLRRKMICELQNLGVLELRRSRDLTELNLEGLVNLRHLELEKLENLEVVKLTGSPDTAESGGIFYSLRYVILRELGSLVYGPDVRLCTSLYKYSLWKCPIMMNLTEIMCPHLKVLELLELVADQFKRMPNVSALHLEHFEFRCECYFDISLTGSYYGTRPRHLGTITFWWVESFLKYLSSNWVVRDYPAWNHVHIRWGKDILGWLCDRNCKLQWRLGRFERL